MISNKLYFLGIDGGASKCRARMRDERGNVLGESVGGSANIYQSFSGAMDEIVSTAMQAAISAGLKTQDLHAGLGLAGLVTLFDAERIRRTNLPFASVAVDNDAYAACVGARCLPRRYKMRRSNGNSGSQ